MARLDWTDPTLIHSLSGALSGVFTAAFVCPLDVLKTRIQVQSHATRYTGIIGGLTTIVKEEGFRAAYKGLTPTVLALLPTWAVYFSAYEYLKKQLKTSQLGSQMSATSQYLLASSGAGALNVIVTNPLWVVKTRLQTQDLALQYAGAVQRRYTGTFDALSKIVRYEGLRGLYSGLAPSLMGIAHVAIQFPLYESLKTRAAAWRGVESTNLQPLDLICLSSAAKMVASTATYPHEVIRSHMHVAGSGAFSGFRTISLRILTEEGVRGFYRGCVTNLIRTTPAAAITFTSYEIINRNLTKLAKAAKDQRGSDSSGAHSSL